VNPAPLRSAPADAFVKAVRRSPCMNLTETLTHQENVMQTLKDHFNYQAHQRYLDLLILWWLLFVLIGQYRRFQNEITYKPRPPFRFG
jgi:hypothetical protein